MHDKAQHLFVLWDVCAAALAQKHDDAKHLYRLTGRVRCCCGSTTRRCITHNNTFIILCNACAAAMAQDHDDATRNTTPLLFSGTRALLPSLINMTMQHQYQHLYRLTGRVRCCLGSTTRRRPISTLLSPYGTRAPLSWLNNTTMQNQYHYLYRPTIWQDEFCHLYCLM